MIKKYVIKISVSGDRFYVSFKIYDDLLDYKNTIGFFIEQTLSSYLTIHFGYDYYLFEFIDEADLYYYLADISRFIQRLEKDYGKENSKN